ncbi:hypothetical protein ACF06P_08845 [Streptomyces sp. NPDC015684]|uniref:hypothetical protein n=1 Tax=Streptomyces sp. NPDC015684 TaxID=3364963 RepID=UPI0036FA0159
MNPTDRFALLCATVAVHRLEVETTVHPEDRQRERLYWVHRAALADRSVPALAELEHPRVSVQDAEDTARRLLEHDRAHATGRGPVPATDARWDTDPRGYTRQEHAALVLNDYNQQSARGPALLPAEGS